MTHPQRIRAASFVLILALLGSAVAQCRFEAPRELDLDLEGVRTIRLVTRAGALQVAGSDAATLTAQGRACASSRAALDDVRLTSSREGDVLVVRTETPRTTFLFGYAHLHLVVALPTTVPVEIEDGSGDVSVTNVASLRLVDGSGAVHVDGVAGDVVLEDGSGGVRLLRVGGSVDVLRDASGDLDVTGVGGSVRIRDDASGGIRIEDVRGDVQIDEDGSGDVDVRRVGGDFVLLHDGSGSVRYADVAGAIDVP